MHSFKFWPVKFNGIAKNARILLWLGLALFFLGLFTKLTWEIKEDAHVTNFDREILLWISNYRLASFNGAAVDISALGSPTVISIVTIISSLILALARDFNGFAYLIIGVSGGGVATFVIKHLFSRERPQVVTRLVEVSGFSYPSGHSLAATSLYLALMFLAWRGFKTLASRFILLCCALFLIFGVGFSRLYLGVHYPSDVMSGMCLGSAWICFLTGWLSRAKR